jgi:hypothetical protein
MSPFLLRASSMMVQLLAWQAFSQLLLFGITQDHGATNSFVVIGVTQAAFVPTTRTPAWTRTTSPPPPKNAATITTTSTTTTTTLFAKQKKTDKKNDKENEEQNCPSADDDNAAAAQLQRDLDRLTMPPSQETSAMFSSFDASRMDSSKIPIPMFTALIVLVLSCAVTFEMFYIGINGFPEGSSPPPMMTMEQRPQPR